MPEQYYEVYAKPDERVDYPGGQLAVWALPPSSGITNFHGKPVPEGNTLMVMWEPQHYDSMNFPIGGLQFPPGYEDEDLEWDEFITHVTSLLPDHLFYWPSCYVKLLECDQLEDVQLGMPRVEEEWEAQREEFRILFELREAAELLEAQKRSNSDHNLEPLNSNPKSNLEPSNSQAFFNWEVPNLVPLAPSDSEPVEPSNSMPIAPICEALVALPVECRFDSYDEVLAFVQAFACQNGFAVSSLRSVKYGPKGIYKKTFISCDKGGKHQTRVIESGRQRQGVTSKCGCEYSVVALQDHEGWQLKHRQDTKYGLHNHELSATPSVHWQHRKLTPAATEKAAKLISKGVQRRDILSVLSATESVLPLARDIGNLTATIRAQELKGRTPVETLLEVSNEEGWISEPKVDDSNHLEALFMMSTSSLDYFLANPDVLIIDCTYKTNRFGLPLLHIVGVDNSGSSFFVGLAFLRTEREEDYQWAIEQLKKYIGNVQPEVIITDRELALIYALRKEFGGKTKLFLCQWHIDKNVLKNCKPHFENKEHWDHFFRLWHEVIFATTQQKYKDKLQLLKIDLLVPKRCVAYIVNTWLDDWKEAFVKCYTDQYPHFGTTVTSRAEGSHKVLKLYIESSSKSLFETWKRVQLGVNQQLYRLAIQGARAKASRIVSIIHMGVYQPIFNKVTTRAFRMMESQRLCHGFTENKAETECTGRWTLIYGLPCGHTIRARIASHHPLEIGDIHRHWYIDRAIATPISTAILDPLPREATISSEDRPTSHTGRILSGHEVVEKQVRHCGFCTPLHHLKAICRGCEWSTHTRPTCPTFHGVDGQQSGVPLSQLWEESTKLSSQIPPSTKEAPGLSCIDRAK